MVRHRAAHAHKHRTHDARAHAQASLPILSHQTRRPPSLPHSLSPAHSTTVAHHPPPPARPGEVVPHLLRVPVRAQGDRRCEGKGRELEEKAVRGRAIPPPSPPHSNLALLPPSLSLHPPLSRRHHHLRGRPQDAAAPEHADHVLGCRPARLAGHAGEERRERGAGGRGLAATHPPARFPSPHHHHSLTTLLLPPSSLLFSARGRRAGVRRQVPGEWEGACV